MNNSKTVELFGIALYQYAIIKTTEKSNKIITAGNDLETIESLYDKQLQNFINKYKDKIIDSEETLMLKDIQEDIIIKRISSLDLL